MSIYPHGEARVHAVPYDQPLERRARQYGDQVRHLRSGWVRVHTAAAVAGGLLLLGKMLPVQGQPALPLTRGYHYTATDLNLAIPDGGGLGTFAQFKVAGLAGPVVEVSVSLEISGSWGGDLFAYVNHAGDHAVLLNRVGRTVSNPIGYGIQGFTVQLSDSAVNGDIHRCWDASGAAPVVSHSGPLTGAWAPDGRASDPAEVLDTDARTATLSALVGGSPNGDWTLFIADVESGSVHTLNGWELTIYTLIPEPEWSGVAIGVICLIWGWHRSQRKRLARPGGNAWFRSP